MKIGIDFDGVILDTERQVRFFAEYYSFFELNKKKINDSILQQKNFKWNKEEQDVFYKKWFDESTKTCDFVPGAKEILQKFQDLEFELYLITKRGHSRECEIELAKKRIKDLGINFKKEFFCVIDKAKLCDELGIDYMIDDNLYNIEYFTNSKTKVIYFKDVGNEQLNQENVLLATSWMDIYKIIVK